MKVEKVIAVIVVIVMFTAPIALAFVAGYQMGEAKGLTMVDWVDRSSYWQGRYEQCVTDGESEDTCYATMNALGQMEQP